MINFKEQFRYVLLTIQSLLPLLRRHFCNVLYLFITRASNKGCERQIFSGTVSNCPLESSFGIISNYFFISFEMFLNYNINNINKEFNCAVRFSFPSFFLIDTVHFLRLDVLFMSCVGGYIKPVMLNSSSLNIISSLTRLEALLALTSTELIIY